MAQHSPTAEHENHSSGGNTKAVLKTLGILSAITIIELFVGMYLAPKLMGSDPHSGLKIWFNIFYLVCTLAKAFYIVSEFMHLGHEVKNLIMTIVFPLFLFVWFIIAFLWEGNSYKSLRDTHNPQPAVKSTQHTSPAPGAVPHAGEHK